VTSEGLIHLEKLKQLEWLWLDRDQATEAGLASLKDLSSLRTVWLPLEEMEGDLVERIRVALPACKFEDSSLQIENLPDSAASAVAGDLVEARDTPVVVWPWSVDELRSMASSHESNVKVATLEPLPAATKQEVSSQAIPMKQTIVPSELAPNLETSSWYLPSCRYRSGSPTRSFVSLVNCGAWCLMHAWFATAQLLRRT